MKFARRTTTAPALLGAPSSHPPLDALLDGERLLAVVNSPLRDGTGTGRAPAVTAAPAPHGDGHETSQRLVEAATSICAAPIAVLSLVHADHAEMVAETGLSATELARPPVGPMTVPLTHAICQHVVRAGTAVAISDTSRADELWGARGELVGGGAVVDYGIGAYLGVPLRDVDDQVIGALCVADTRPRPWTRAQISALTGLAQAAGMEARLRQERSLRERTQTLATAVITGAMDAIVVVDAANIIVEWNPAAEQILGWSAWDAIGQPLAELIIPVDQRAAHLAALAQHLQHGTTRILGQRVRTHALRADGSTVPVELTVTSCGTPAQPMFAGHLRDLRPEITLREERDRAAELFRAVVEESPAGIYLTSMDRREVTYVSPQLDEWFGSPGLSWAAKRHAWLEAIHPQDRARVRQAMAASDAAGEPLVSEHRVISAAGPMLHVRVQERHVLGPDAMPVARLGVIMDVTAALESAERLASARAQLHHVLNSAPMMLFALDPEGVFTLVEGKALAGLGMSASELLGRSVFDLAGKDPVRRARLRSALGGAAFTTVADLKGRTFETSYSPVRDADGAVVTVIGVAIDITERIRTDRELAHHAVHDPVTDLLDRRGLLFELNYALADAARDGHGLAVALLDIDGFRTINDSLGHAAGDDLLRAVADSLRTALADYVGPYEGVKRRSLALGRHGADQFVVVLPGPYSTLEVAQDVAARLLSEVASTPATLGHDDQRVTADVTATAGLSLYPIDAMGAEELLAHADTAMYAAKRDQRGSVGLYDPRCDKSRARLSMTAKLRKAIDDELVIPAFQPVVDLTTGACDSVEALARWHDPDLGQVSPLEFIDLAEDTGLIVALGRLMRDKTCQQLATWRDQGLFVRVAVNVSARELRSPTFLTELDEVLSRHHLPADALAIELTESAATEHRDGVAAALAGVRERGVRVAIDDFGTGHSSLARLHDLDVDVLKLDLSFVSALPSPWAQTLINAVIAIAEALHLDTIAEGIETKEQRAWLASAGVRCGQGYLFARPMPGVDLARWLRGSAARSATARSTGVPLQGGAPLRVRSASSAPGP